METTARELLRELLLTPSPTGHEQAIQRYIRDHFAGIADEIEADVHGNLVLKLNPDRGRKILIAAHCDQIGFLVKYVTPDGYIYLDSVGGNDFGVVPGEHVVIQSRDGPIEGVIGRKPLNLQQGAEIQQIPPATKIWVDIGASSSEEVLKQIRIGDYMTFRLEVTELRNGLIAAPGLDNKAGLFIALETLRRCADRGCDATLLVASTVQEEIGSRGAATVTSRHSPEIGIAVDVIPATDDPGYDLPPQAHAPCRLGGGPTISIGPNTNPVVGALLEEAAQRRQIAFQTDPSGSTLMNDARVIQTADSGVATAAIGIPQRNMHSQVEIVSLDDLEQSIELLTEFVASFPADTDLRPINFTGAFPLPAGR